MPPQTGIQGLQTKDQISQEGSTLSVLTVQRQPDRRMAGVTLLRVFNRQRAFAETGGCTDQNQPTVFCLI